MRYGSRILRGWVPDFFMMERTRILPGFEKERARGSAFGLALMPKDAATGGISSASFLFLLKFQLSLVFLQKLLQCF